MRALKPNQTKVVYTIDADPGGWLPVWARKKATLYIPVSTLNGLRKRAKTTRGWYQAFIEEHTPKPIVRRPPKPANKPPPKSPPTQP